MQKKSVGSCGRGKLSTKVETASAGVKRSIQPPTNYDVELKGRGGERKREKSGRRFLGKGNHENVQIVPMAKTVNGDLIAEKYKSEVNLNIKKN